MKIWTDTSTLEKFGWDGRKTHVAYAAGDGDSADVVLGYGYSADEAMAAALAELARAGLEMDRITTAEIVRS